MTVDQAQIVAPPKLVWDEKFHRTYTSVYQVIADTTDGPVAVANAIGIPSYGSSFSYGNETDFWAFCKSVSVDHAGRIKDPQTSVERQKWLLTVTHTSVPSDTDPGKSRDNPLLDTPVVGGSFQQYIKNAYRDKDGDPIVNTAKDPYIPPPTIEDSYDTLTISFNTAFLNLSFRAGFRNTVNSSAIWNLGVRRVKMMQWNYRVLYAGSGMKYIRNDFEFLISYREHPTADVVTGNTNEVGWFTTLPNSGYRYYDTGTISADNEKIFKAEDVPTNTPGNLKSNGDKAAPTDNQNWNVFAIEGEKDFSTIPGMPVALPGPFV